MTMRMARTWTFSNLRGVLSSLSDPPAIFSSSSLRNLSTAVSQNLQPQSNTVPRSTTRMTSTISDLINKSRIYNLSVYRSLYPMRTGPRRKIKRIHLPTHYVEVSYKLRKAVVFYQPSIGHIPHGIKERNPLLITSGASRGQNT